MSGGDEGYVGRERREEPDLRVLQNDIVHIQKTLERIEKWLESLEGSVKGACSSCALNHRVHELERAREKQDDRLRAFEAKVGGISAIVGIATAVIIHILTKVVSR